jgi:hypothetical protein
MKASTSLAGTRDQRETTARRLKPDGNKCELCYLTGWYILLLLTDFLLFKNQNML